MKLTKHMVEINGMKYFRGNAHLVNLGTVGKKYDPIGAKAYLDPERNINRDKIEAYIKDQNYAVDINFSKYTQGDLEVNGKVKVYGVKLSGSSSYSYSKLKTAKLSLLNFHLNEAQLKRLINNNSSVFNFLKNEGNDARIVSEIWIVVEAEIAEAVDLSRTINVGAKFNKNNKLDVQFNLKSGKNHTISISTGSVFAYKMHKVKDYDKRRKKATKVTDLTVDYKGML